MTIKGQVRHAFPAYKVFIFGTEVTEDDLDVEVQYNSGRAPNTCSITLANDLDKYIMTTQDLKVLYQRDDVDEAFISEPFSNSIPPLFHVTTPTCIHDGKFSYINLTFCRIPTAVICLLARIAI